MPRYGLSPAGRGLFSLALPCAVLGSLGGQPVVLGLGISIGLFMVLAYSWSAVSLRTVTISASPAADVTAGECIEMSVSVEGPAGLECAVQVTGSDCLGVSIPATGKIHVQTPYMGRFDTIPATIQTGVPDGLVGAVDRRVVILGEPAFVYPAPVICNVDAAPMGEGAFADPSGELAGLREYTPGDRIRDVHWPALARTGTLLVRDNRAAPSGGPVAVVVGVAVPANLELVAGYARHAIHLLLQRGHSVKLTIGAESAPVVNESQAWRRLAVMVPGLEPSHTEAEIPTLVVGAEEGATWLPRT